MKIAASNLNSFLPVRKVCAFLWLLCALYFLGTGPTEAAQNNANGQTNSFSTNETKLIAPQKGSNSVSSSNSVIAASSGSTSTNNTAPSDDHRLAIGDRLSFRIVEDEDGTNMPLFVTDSGDVEVPYIGRVPAENKTCKELAEVVKAALEKDYYYHATVLLAVDVMTKSHGRVYLVGAVRNPGPVELPSDENLTLSKAILRAGGFTDFADRRHVKITRKDDKEKSDKKTLVVNVGKIFDDGKVELDVPLQTGDLIFIPDRLIRF